MKVSVVIPTYNEEKYIGKCLESLVRQVAPADEIIVVDNNSTDKTALICKAFAVRLIKEKKQGTTPARNRGLDQAKYEIIARCDADTIVPKNWVEKIKKNFLKKNIDALTGPIVFYDLPFKSVLYSKAYIAGMRAVKKHNILNGPNMALTKNMWKKVRGEVCLLDTKVQEDIDLSLHIKEHGGHIAYDDSFTVLVSGRRIKSDPLSFFIEYPIKSIRTLSNH